jgi:PKHD-type hydroxylase
MITIRIEKFLESAIDTKLASTRYIEADKLARQHDPEQVADLLLEDPLFKLAALPRLRATARLRVLGPGEALDWTSPPALSASASPVRIDLWALVVLSQADEGGCLRFCLGGRETQLCLGVGDAVAFPARTRHAVTTVHRGVQSMVEIGVQSLVRCPERREILYEVGSSVELTEILAPDQVQEVGKLRALHENLLRLWAEP